MNIKYIKKDITELNEGVLVHGVNCRGVMGSGVAKAIRRKWPVVYDEYIKFVKQHDTAKSILGKINPVIVSGKPFLSVINAFTQINYGRKGIYADPLAIYNCLVLSTRISDQLHIPKIGCGLGGLHWEMEVLPIIETIVYDNMDVSFTVYEL